MNHRRSRLGVVTAVLGVLAAAWPRPARAATAHPTVEEAPAGLHGFPFTLGCCYFDYGEAGYLLKEYFVSGTAKTYTDPSTTAPYKTRILVAVPSDPAKFNGTVLAEWENVTAQVPAEPGMVWMHYYMLRKGYGYAAVVAQKVGADNIKIWDPVRYETLSHPGDDYSYDIFSQAVDALKDPIGLSPMGDVTVERVIGYGQSQSAGRLNNYLVLAQNDAAVVDGMITQAGGSNKSFPDLQIPYIQLDTEEAIDAVVPDAANPSDLYRLWEVVGTAHVGNEETQSPGSVTLPLALTIGTQIPWELDQQYWEHSHYGEEGPGLGVTCVGGVEMPVRYALDAALDALDRNLIDGTSLPSPPRALFNPDGSIMKDEHGNAMGGLRLPPIEVPVATYNATTCSLFGNTMPFTPDKLFALYPTNADYAAKMYAAIDDALAARIMVPEDADELRRKVGRSLIPLYRPSTQFGIEPGGCPGRC